MPDNHQPSLGPLIGRGRTADIYAWEDKRVIKLFHLEWPAEWIDYEYRILKIINEALLSSPTIGGKAVVDGRTGIIMKRIIGDSMLEEIIAKPWRLNALAELFANLHVNMHVRQSSQLPWLKEKLRHKIDGVDLLGQSLKDKLLRTLGELPDDDSICHGDFHPGNIILSPDGPVIIDWVDASHGNSLADLARTSLLLRESPLPAGFNPLKRNILQVIREVFYKEYIQQYSRLKPFSENELWAWMPIVAAARLSENIPGESEILLRIASRDS